MKYTDKVERENELENTYYYRDNRADRIDELQRENTVLMQENKRLQEELARLKREFADKGLIDSVDIKWYVHDFSEVNPGEWPKPSDVSISCSDPDHIEICVMAEGLTGLYQEAIENAEHIVKLHNEEVK